MLYLKILPLIEKPILRFKQYQLFGRNVSAYKDILESVTYFKLIAHNAINRDLVSVNFSSHTSFNCEALPQSQTFQILSCNIAENIR